jgi:pimeloyl-ACP methyl ester carboxylesterase
MNSKPNPWKKVSLVAVLIILVVAILYFAVCTFAILKVTEIAAEYRDKPLEPTPSQFGVAYQDVRFPARNDGLTIAGWYLPNENSSSAVILVHGRHENRATAMGGTYPQFAAALHEAGFAVLMLDVRGHGQSDEARYDFGLKAKNDVLGAVDWLLAQGFARGNIGAMGISLGGGAVNFAAAEEPAIGAVVADSTVSDLGPIIEAQWQAESGLPNFFLPGVYLMHQILFGFDIRDAVPIDAISSMEMRPFLIVHCKVDADVPFNQAQAMQEAMPYAEHWYIDDGCEHAQINTVMPEVYESHIIPFFEKNLP